MDYQKKRKRQYMRNALNFIEKAKGKGVKILDLEKYSKYILPPLTYISFFGSDFFYPRKSEIYKIERMLAVGKIIGFGMWNDILYMVGKVYHYDTKNKKYRKFILVPLIEYDMKVLTRCRLKSKYEFGLLLRKGNIYEVTLQKENATWKISDRFTM